MKNRTGKKIMIVDDDMGILEAFELLLGDDYSLVMADNGYKAMDILGRETPSLIFLDINMPGIDGRKILTYIKDTGVGSKVVVVTGSSENGLEEDVNALGAYDYIKKPFDIVSIESITKGVLGKE